MSVFNPDVYREQYKETIDNARDVSGWSGISDVQRQMIADMSLMNAQWDIDNAWYDAHQSSQAKFDELRDLGINPLSAARSVMGSQQSANQGSAPAVTGTGADSSFTSSLGAVDAFGTVVNGLNQSVQTDLAREQTGAQVRNLESQTANNVAQNPFIAPQAKANIMKTEAEAMESTTHAQTMSVQQQQIIADADLKDTEKRQIEKAILRYDEYTTAQINEMQSHANLYFEEAKTQSNIRQNIDADTVLKGAETSNQYAQADNALAQSKYYDEQTGQLMTINQFCNATGIPLGADESRTLQYYVETGQFDKAQTYLNTIFDAAAAREGGTQSQSLPADNYRSEFNHGTQYYYSHPNNGREALFRGFFWRGRDRFFNPYKSSPSNWSYPSIHY